ncbi:ScbR family autoregulator-binding transcription factor [Streptomyces sp. NK08204]|uniref:ScbR family autoregulator-binding transcription factor n=1 Tax=Streptomyces sp. NK08204 TaxID=2873260 RepID=UPI001CEDE7A0|nr:ScbR family autoregulator-binding transcription factor [Streptomyces sp. NK08204]
MAKQERAVRTREALIRAAAETFDQDGFPVAALTRISARAGVSSGALHFHFASKAALADSVEETAAVALRTLTSESFSPGLSHLQHLVDATHRLAQALREDVVLRVGFGLSGEATHACRTDLRACWRSWVETEVANSAAGGELRADVPPQRVSAAVLAATTGFEVLGARDAAWLSAEAIGGFWRLLLPALVEKDVLAGLAPAGRVPPKPEAADA